MVLVAVPSVIFIFYFFILRTVGALRVSLVFELLGRDKHEIGQISNKDLTNIKSEYNWKTINEKKCNEFLDIKVEKSFSTYKI